MDSFKKDVPSAGEGELTAADEQQRRNRGLEVLPGMITCMVAD